MDDSVEAYKMSAPVQSSGFGGVEAVMLRTMPEVVGPTPQHAEMDAVRPLNRMSVQARKYRRANRLLDVTFSLGFLLVTGPWLFPVIAILIKLGSRGPVLFRQERVGWMGDRFVCLKFRTMSVDPDAEFTQAQKNDPRVTRVGKFLRQTNLDELPQFINVLRGEMSVVGPRPHVYQLDELHCDTVPGYELRTLIRPGVTGLAQISGCRGETRSLRDMEHRIRFDLFYLKNMSLMLDLKIILLTALRVVQGDSKAY
jgi:putative colanic acid biosynthesis UDP-glucose lipid carrier transferase